MAAEFFFSRAVFVTRISLTRRRVWPITTSQVIHRLPRKDRSQRDPSKLFWSSIGIYLNMAADFISVWGRRRIWLFFRSRYLKCWDLHIGFVEPLQKRIVWLQQSNRFYALVFWLLSIAQEKWFYIYTEVMSGFISYHINLEACHACMDLGRKKYICLFKSTKHTAADIW
jgi:hypothetical protein